MAREHPVDLCCSFCGKSQREVRKLIAGPTVYICDECIKLCNDILTEEAKRPEPAPERKPAPLEEEGSAGTLNQTLCCSFCGKSQRKVKNLIAGPTVYICDECIGLCNDIIAEEIELESVTAQVRSRLPEAARVLIATVLDRGSSAAERVSRFAYERDKQIRVAIHRRDPDLTREQFFQRFLEESAKARPSPKGLAGMATLAFEWKRLHTIVGGRPRMVAEERPADTTVAPPGPPPETGSELGEWLRPITERLKFTLEVLDALAKRLDEPGFEPSRQSVDMAHEKLDQARDFVMAGPPAPSA